MAEIIKNKYRIVFMGSEGFCYGDVWLTDEEAKLAKKILDKRTWENSVEVDDKWAPNVWLEKRG